MSYKIRELDYHAKVVDQVAQVAVTQSFVNTGSRQMEVAFVFPVPYDSAIDRMTFMVDGKEYDAKLLDAKDARKTYEEYVRRIRTLLGGSCGMLKTVSFRSSKANEISLKFSQLLAKTTS
jgi:Ca-activated chloride channel family protein